LSLELELELELWSDGSGKRGYGCNKDQTIYLELKTSVSDDDRRCGYNVCWRKVDVGPVPTCVVVCGVRVERVIIIR
jgi:hypothetical protein